MMKNTICGIYKITNLKTGKIYIGSAQSVATRWNNHLTDLSNNRHTNYKLQNSFNKWGADNFQFNVIELCKKDELKEREQYYLDTLGKAQEYIDRESKYFFYNTYNIKPKVDGTVGLDISKEALMRMNKKKGVGRTYKVDVNGNILKEYDFRYQAADDNKVSRVTVSNSIKNKKLVNKKDFGFVDSKNYVPNKKLDKHEVWNKGLKGVTSGETKPVFVYDIYGRHFKTFSSGIATAEYFKVHNSRISAMMDKPKKKVLHSIGIHLYNMFSSPQKLENRIEEFGEDNGKFHVQTLMGESVGYFNDNTISDILECHIASISNAKRNQKLLKGFTIS